MCSNSCSNLHLSIIFVFVATDFGYATNGVCIEIEKGDTISKLMTFMREDKSSNYYHKVIIA